MNIFVCTDKKGGMTFGGRRQSSDRVLREKILSLTGDMPLFLNEYSASQFENKENLVICEDFLHRAGKDDFCFAENEEIPKEKADRVFLFNWNRDYPADFFLNLDLSEYKKVKKEEFTGSSHKKITLTVYEKGGAL